MPWQVGAHTGGTWGDTSSLWGAWQRHEGWSCLWCGESLAHSSALLLPSPCRVSRSGAASRPPSLGMLVCKLPLYHIIMRCLGYQQISRRLGREGCSTIRKCQLAASSFCRSLNPIFLTCISATGTGPLHSDKPPGEPQREHCYGDPAAQWALSQCPQTPECPGLSWHAPAAPARWKWR